MDSGSAVFGRREISYSKATLGGIDLPDCLHDYSRYRRKNPRPAAHERRCAGRAAAGADIAGVQYLQGAARLVGLGRRFCRGRHRGCAGRLVCRDRAVSASVGRADSAHRHHPAQPPALGQCPGAIRARQISRQRSAAATHGRLQPGAQAGRVSGSPGQSATADATVAGMAGHHRGRIR